MKQTKKGDWVASDGTIISADANPGDLRGDAQKHAELADRYQALADALRHGDNPSDNRRYGFYQDSRGCWRDADNQRLTEYSYEEPLIQAHRLAGKHQVLSKDFTEVARLNSSRSTTAKADYTHARDDSDDSKRTPVSRIMIVILFIALFLILLYLAFGPLV